MGAGGKQTNLEAAGMSFGQTSNFNYRGSVISDIDELDGAVSANLIITGKKLYTFELGQ